MTHTISHHDITSRVMRDHAPYQNHWNGADFKSQLQRFEFTGTISMLAASLIPVSQLTFIAGIGLLVWILFRRQMISKRRFRAEALESNKTLAAQKAESARSLPLADAPVETQRWQVAMFELHRDLKADLDTRIAVVNTLLRQVDERIAHLEKMSR